MKKVLLIALLFFSYHIGICHAQELPNLKNVKLGKKSSYKNAEPTVLKVVDYLFQTPIDKKNKARSNAGQFLINWMNGTPDYIFYLEEKETNFFSTDSDLLLMYMAALTKYTLLHKELKTQKELALGAISIALPYLYQQSDRKTWSKELWQLNDANQNHKLEVYLYQ
ncbi:hypothetical protein [Pedobacter sp. ASV28]|uniref:hypothetical protein n=1 Tax=Pedobacter sp. ASV28 TaxID=2795123 RepID=UPI0018EC5479|nr:hypothetical protein [Pedobacter sp. ASV28]